MKPLQFHKDGTFKIVQFTDIHWQNNNPADLCSLDLMNNILDHETPDLVIFTGDMIHSELADDPKTAFIHAVSAVTARNIPWAFVFGNHDAEEGITRDEIMAISKELPACLAQQGPAYIGGIGNYFLTIQSSTDIDRIKTALFLFDSGSYAPKQIGGSAWIRRDQIDWYIQESLHLEAKNENRPIPSLSFFHIPLPEFNDLWDFHTSFGYNYEGVGCPKINSGLFNAFLERGDVTGVFVGHDHVNDFWGNLHGIRLCYGRATGFNTYGKEDFPRGARVIKLYEANRDFETWLRLEGGVLMKDQPVHPPSFRDISVQLTKRLSLH
ncbi:metallophosphoesterase family protein [Paenibacillus sp. NEAU-GSW1]|uniref:metallophosphoesterase family protein n=1 Tax=Paenibacillus sp. NEAU-GSW1 TaxID=2682486 RepID=UPI0012E24399|nr:metallophosphoesterase family protein [Paenibacillus sp. NEAU-GSW1]MUT64734.1 metallophosphoesterase [Paenibacillus sp. NEAU-GSW1]